MFSTQGLEVLKVVQLIAADAEDQSYGWEVGSIALITEEEPETSFCISPWDCTCASWLGNESLQEVTHLIMSEVDLGPTAALALKLNIEDEIDNNPEVPLKDIAEANGVVIGLATEVVEWHPNMTYIPIRVGDFSAAL